MYKLLLILSAVWIAGCSSSSEISKNSADAAKMNGKKKSRLAMEYVINGAVLESKNDYDGAVQELEKAKLLSEDAGIYYALGKNYFYLHKIPNALQNSLKSVELDPDKIEYYDLLSDIYSAANQFDSSASVLEKIIRLDSTRIYAYYKLARIYENSKPLEAINIYQKITENTGPEWNVLIRVAELHEKLGNINEAASALEKLAAIDPSNNGIRKLLMELYQRGKQYDKALLVVNDILELTPDDLDARERKALLFIEQGNWEDAAAEYTYIVDRPDIPLDSKIRVGVTYFVQSFSDSSVIPSAKKIFTKIDKDTTNWQVKMYLGAVSQSESDFDTAEKYFKESAELADFSPEGWIRLGGLYFDNQKFKEAANLMKYAAAKFPEEFVINLIYGLSLAQTDKNEEALPFLKKSVELNGTDINALSAYAFTLQQLGESEEAVLYVKKALAIAPDDVNLLGTLGMIYDNLEQWELCDSVYTKALSIDSTNALVNNNYAYSLSERGIKLNEALKMAETAIAQDPENSSYLDTIGWIYYKLEDYEKAKEFIEKSLNRDSENSEVLDHLGDVVYKLGNKNEAVKFWSKALELDTENEKLKEKIKKGEI